MGVNFKDIISPNEITLKELNGKKIAVDAYNAVFQFLSTIRLPTGEPLKDSHGNITSHLSGLFFRNINLLSNGIKPCYVWDGEPPEFKKTVILERKERKKQAIEKYKKAVELGIKEDIIKYAQQTAKMTDVIVEDSKKLLDLMGIPSVQAKSEGEATCSYMVRKKDVWATASQDYDCLLHGSERLLRNVNITGRRKLPGRPVYVAIKPEIIVLSENLKRLGLSQEQLIIVAILIGTDYNPRGIKGIGPKTALKLVKKHRNLKKVIENVDWKFDISAEEIYNWFLNPEVTKKYSLEWNPIDKKEVVNFLCDKHDFSRERVENALSKIKNQTTLFSF